MPTHTPSLECIALCTAGVCWRRGGAAGSGVRSHTGPFQTSPFPPCATTTNSLAHAFSLAPPPSTHADAPFLMPALFQKADTSSDSSDEEDAVSHDSSPKAEPSGKAKGSMASEGKPGKKGKKGMKDKCKVCETCWRASYPPLQPQPNPSMKAAVGYGGGGYGGSCNWHRWLTVRGTPCPSCDTVVLPFGGAVCCTFACH